MRKIEIDDKVRHKSVLVNNGFPMNVLDVKDDKALCYYLDIKSIPQDDWFDTNDLEVIIYGEGEFLKI